MTTIIPGLGGERYTPYDERRGNESVVYFTRDLSAGGLRRLYARVSGNIRGKVAIKLHTGEQYGPNIIPHQWVEAKRHMLGSYPSLKAMYSAEDDNTEVLYLKDATATFSSFTEAPRTIRF